jgi:hypothetical protein
VKHALGIGKKLLRAPDHAASGLEIAVGHVKQAMAFDDEFAGMLDLLVERDSRCLNLGRRHDPAPVSALARQSPTQMLANRSP